MTYRHFAGWWQTDDLDIKRQYQLIDDQQYQQQLHERQQEKQRLLRFIQLHSAEQLSETSDASAFTVNLPKHLHTVRPVYLHFSLMI
ncbi:hypothetical protein P4S68_15165 [Pseudoalteromonas sp. Hal099]